MWVRKSEAEIQQFLAQNEAEKKNIVRPLLFATAISIVVMLLYSFGLRGCSRGFVFVAQQPDGFNGRTIFAGLFMFALFAVIAIYHQRTYGYILGGEHDIWRCRDCKQLEHVNLNKTCSACDGKQEPSGFFSWVEDEDSGKILADEPNK